MATTKPELLTRENSIRNNIDPRGVQWGIFPQDGRSLLLVYATKKDDLGKTIPDMRYQIPAECAGEWTHQNKAQHAIEVYLDRAWRESEEADQRLKDRKIQAKKAQDILEESEGATS